MKHIKNFNELFESNSTDKEKEDTRDMIGQKIKNIDYNKGGELEIHLMNDEVIYFGCEGGNVVSLYSETLVDINNYEQYKGLTINSVIRQDAYSIEVTFDNNKSFIVEDDTGGEGLGVYKK